MRDGSAVCRNLVLSGGVFIAVSVHLLVDFATSANAATEKVLYSFCSPPNCAAGANPVAGLVNVNGTLYGTTSDGGTNDYGTVFSITPRGKEKLVYTFGTGSDAQDPAASLIDVKGTLYGTTISGGDRDSGTVFSVDPTTGTEKVLYSFANGGDGAYPFASLIDVNGILYGTTVNGGGFGCAGGGCGTVFAVNRVTGKEKALYSFGDGSGGKFPRAGLLNVHGTLYGTTSGGGSVSDDGTVFSITTDGTEKVLYTFGPNDAQGPYASLIDVNGTLYGTTTYGGTIGWGTVFSLTPGGTENVVHSFSGDDGQFPRARLVNAQGTLYGTTAEGGTEGGGTVFSITPDGTEQVLHSFGSGTDGSIPDANLINVDGTLYGTTSLGGTNGGGTVFSITL